jgi:dihydropteroate synthase
VSAGASIAPAFAIGGRTYDLGTRALVAGVVNVTPDSFSDGGRFLDPGAAIAHAHALIAEGADLLDLGAESTRPGAVPVPADEELRRLRPVLEGLRGCGAPITVDTAKPEVASVALDLGASGINDVGGLRLLDRDGRPAMAVLAAKRGASLIAMHMQGEPGTMQRDPHYSEVVYEVGAWLAERARAAEAAGVSRDRIAIDPGIGFGKTPAHNLDLLRHTDRLAALGWPVMIGVSRKSLFGKLLGLEVGDRMEAGLAVTVVAVLRGARLVRTHDVRPTVWALRAAEAIR